MKLIVHVGKQPERAFQAKCKTLGGALIFPNIFQTSSSMDEFQLPLIDCNEKTNWILIPKPTVTHKINTQRNLLFDELNITGIKQVLNKLQIPLSTTWLHELRHFTIDQYRMIRYQTRVILRQKPSDTYIQSNVDKDILLKPKSSALGQSSNLLSLTNDDHDITSHELYSCGKKSNNYSSGLGSHRSTKKYSCPNKYVADDPKATCPDCGSLLNKFLTFVPPPNSTEVGSSSSSSSRANDDVGIVKGVVTYMIMDDLEVKPMSSISSIALLNTFNVKEIGALQEKIVSVGINEGLRLLKASLLTKTVLTHVL
ncbi:hypothetical protein F8388_025745 [Cannabis sativa]|uniref:Uncharacterized protein n=1 Tax=Cannabis sativa TaxID=3483 RepID=A0A7J6F9A7_CANSA|nr:hypothetical protein F8388_025745 [Cannabis sativa]